MENAEPKPDQGESAEMLTLITELGMALNQSSYPTPRTQQVLTDIAETYQVPIEAEVFPTLVLGVNREHGSLAVSQTGGAFRFDQMAAAQNLIVRLRKKSISISDALTQLRAIGSAPPPIPAGIRVIGYVLMALGFASIFRMGIPAMAAAAALALLIGSIMLWSNLRGTFAALMPVLMTFMSAMVMATAAAIGDTDDPVRVAAVPVLILIPGAALTTAVIELTGGDMIAGASRLMYAIVVLLSMAFGFALAIDIANLPTSSLQDLTNSQTPAWVPWLGVPIFALGNVLYFCTPKRLWVWVVVVAVGAFGISQLCQQVISLEFASGIAAGFALLAAWNINNWLGGGPSALVLFLPSFWMLVPGSMSFVAISGVFTDDKSLSQLGTSAAVTLMSTAVCIMIASLIQQGISKYRPVRSVHREITELL